jgi:palmitoyltransferase
MDHHCPWTSNCVSHFTFPHFIRFLFFAVASMGYLEYFLYLRAAKVWEDRHLPAYLGPGVWDLVLLFALLVTNTMTLFLVGIMLARAVYGAGGNVTTIEGWEIERHHQLLRRARVLGGYLDGPDGIKVRIERHEFPFDVGIWPNICQAMGTSNFLAWFWPFARGMRTDGLSFETNGFEEPGQSWPPPDPDRMPRLQRKQEAEDAFIHTKQALSPEEELRLFKERQQADLNRRQAQEESILLRRKRFGDRYDGESNLLVDDDYLSEDDEEHSGEEAWADSDGNRLRDFGVEEDLEFYDEDDIPIAELLRRRRGHENVRV